MQVILTENVPNLGNRGDIVQVANGYARNFLIPQQKAERATSQAKLNIEQQQAQNQEKLQQHQAAAQQRADAITKAVKSLTIARPVNSSEKLYGALSVADVADALKEAGHEIDKAEISLPDGIKTLGAHKVEITFHKEVRFPIEIEIVAEKDGA